MIYLTGVTNDDIEPAVIEHGMGLMVQPSSGYAKRVLRYPCWAADNGCFNPKTYIGHDAWLNWLDRLPREKCLFAVVPDVSRRPDGSLGGDPRATWHLFEEYGPLVQEMGFPAALAAQDGFEHMPDKRDQIDACDCLFIGGSTPWKLGAAAERLVRLARSRGKWVHMGRVNSQKRIERARAMGCNSVDGTFLAWAPRTNLPRIRRWLVWLGENPIIETFETPAKPVHKEAVSA